MGDHFSSSEFECQCNYKSCVEQKISKVLIDKLNLVRIETGSPLYVTSGFRCSKHQSDLRKELNSGKSNLTVVASKVSQHELGNAADISPRVITMAKLRKIIEKSFDSIGLAKTFFHIDIRPLKNDGSKRIWKY
jgi:uncharacterized protein YcbK (DUF882 family)